MKKFLFYFLFFTLFPFCFATSIYAILRADGNKDGRVDGEDYVIWLTGYGQNQDAGNYDTNGIVDGRDYIIWIQEYGKIVATDKPSYVTRQNADLFIERNKTRFAGANIFWLQLDSRNGQLLYPSQFRIYDALYTVREMGGNVIRTWANSVGCPLCIQPAKDTFNAEAFQSLDYAIKLAKEYNIRIILTLSDNYQYYHGGKSNFTSWYGVNEDEFYTNRQVIEAYKRYISSILNHVNVFTGTMYKNDLTIMAWETGNELSWNMHFSTWTREISDYIKLNAPQQLVIDGHYGIDQSSVALPNVDIFSNHYRTKSELMNESISVASHNKAYLLGEYKWNGGRNESDDLTSFVQNIEQSKTNIAIFWSLLSHDDVQGFVNHNDGYSMYYPGTTSDEINRTQILRKHFFRMNKISELPHSSPPSPVLKGSKSGSQIILNWRGSPTSVSYVLERSNNQGATWNVISSTLKDNNPTFQDTPTTLPVSYRIKGITIDSIQGQNSNIVSFK